MSLYIKASKRRAKLNNIEAGVPALIAEAEDALMKVKDKSEQCCLKLSQTEDELRLTSHVNRFVIENQKIKVVDI